VTWEVQVEVLKAADAWANPDVGNFPDEESRREGVEARSDTISVSNG
jgi:hypothetical protein